MPRDQTDLPASIKPLRACFIWHGLPAYAARLLRSVVDEPGIDLRIFATKSPEAPQYLEQIIGRPITWADDQNARSLAESTTADVLFVTGWAFPICNRFVASARARGTPVVAMIDNRWRGDLRQRLGSVYFRVSLLRTLDFAWVPSHSAARLCRALGFRDEAVFRGLYGGDGTLFTPAVGVSRPPRVGFVGQLIRRKGFDLLVSAFQRLRQARPEYELHVYGSGDLAPLASDVAGIVVHPFAQPDVIADAMRKFRIFVMPSRDDNWPLALHEAALSGCTLLTTREVGNADELVQDANGLVIRSGSSTELAAGLATLAAWPAERHLAAAAVSRRLAEPFGPVRWRQEFLRICAVASSARAKAV